MKGSTIKVKLTSDSYKKWIKWQKNLGELLMCAEQERETGFLLIINVKKNYGYATLLGCDGALLAALVYVSLRYFAAKLGAEGLIAYMLWHNYRMPTKKELDKAKIWILKKRLGVKTDWRDMP